jgi:hypothetical protein
MKKNKQGNKHLKNNPYMTLRSQLKDYYYVILERFSLDDVFEYIVTDNYKDDTDAYIGDADAMLDAAIFRCEKDAEVFLNKLIRNRHAQMVKEQEIDDAGDISKEDFEIELQYFRVMSIKEFFMADRLINEAREKRT